MRKQKKKQKRKARSLFAKPIFWILLLALFLRIYKLTELFHWTLDEEFWSYIPFNIATGYHFPLIGGHISGTGLYSGPLFVWLMAFPLMLTGGNPIGTVFFVSILGVVTTAVMYSVGKALFEKNVGVMAALLSATSFLWVIYDRKYWNATPIPLLSLLTILCLYKIAKGKLKWTYLLAGVLALAFHAHMTSGALLIFVAVSWIVLRLPVKRKEVILSLLLFLVLQLPLVAFEFRHQFLNTRALVALLRQPDQAATLHTAVIDVAGLATKTAGRLIYAPGSLDIAKELTLCTDYATTRFDPPLWTAALAVAGVLFLIRRKKSKSARLLLILMGANILGIIWYRLRAAPGNWYPGQLSEYFFFPSFPALTLGFALLATSVVERLGKRRILGQLALFLLVLGNVNAILTARHSDSFARKWRIVNTIVKEVDEQPFTLDVKGDDPCLLYGYRYIFSYLGVEPTQSYLDPEFLWLYEKRLPSREATKAVVITLGSGKVNYEISSLP